jgi:hypothetical protein
VCYYTLMALSPHQRMAGYLLAGVVVLGSGLLWIAIPIATFWLASRVTSDSVRGVLFALLAIPAAMGIGAWALYRVNGLYESLRGEGGAPPSPPSWRASLGEERKGLSGPRRPVRLIDLAMTISALIALGLFLIWYFASPDMRLAPLS